MVHETLKMDIFRYCNFGYSRFYSKARKNGINI